MKDQKCMEKFPEYLFILTHGAINKTGDATPIGQRGKRRPNEMRALSGSTYWRPP